MTSTLVGRKRRPVRTLFVSDVHLGCKYSQTDAFLNFLEHHEPETIYLVGDFIDGWRLKKKWYWNETKSRVVQHLIEMANCGVRIVYTPGNHDDFLREHDYQFDFVEIVNEIIHTTADGRRFYIAHGDMFDHVERNHRWLSLAGSVGYDLLCWASALINRVRRCIQMAPCNFSSWAKRRVKRAVQFVSDFEQRIIQHARQLQCDGVICGHIHTPTIAQSGDVVYCNTGDWVENRTGIIEHFDGALELVRWDWTRSETTPDTFTAPLELRGHFADVGNPRELVAT